MPSDVRTLKLLDLIAIAYRQVMKHCCACFILENYFHNLNPRINQCLEKYRPKLSLSRW